MVVMWNQIGRANADGFSSERAASSDAEMTTRGASYSPLIYWQFGEDCIVKNLSKSSFGDWLIKNWEKNKYPKLKKLSGLQVLGC